MKWIKNFIILFCEALRSSWANCELVLFFVPKNNNNYKIILKHIYRKIFLINPEFFAAEVNYSIDLVESYVGDEIVVIAVEFGSEQRLKS